MKPLGELSPNEIEHDNPEIRRVEEMAASSASSTTATCRGRPGHADPLLRDQASLTEGARKASSLGAAQCVLGSRCSLASRFASRRITLTPVVSDWPLVHLRGDPVSRGCRRHGVRRRLQDRRPHARPRQLAVVRRMPADHPCPPSSATTSATAPCFQADDCTLDVDLAGHASRSSPQVSAASSITAAVRSTESPCAPRAHRSATPTYA